MKSISCTLRVSLAKALMGLLEAAVTSALFTCLLIMTRANALKRPACLLTGWREASKSQSVQLYCLLLFANSELLKWPVI